MIKYEPTRKRIERCIELHLKMKWAYFKVAPQSATQRRAFERLRSEYFTFKHKGVKYIVDQSSRCRGGRVIYKLHITVDGVKKDVRILKKLVDWNNQRDLEKMQDKLLATVNPRKRRAHAGNRGSYLSWKNWNPYK